MKTGRFRMKRFLFPEDVKESLTEFCFLKDLNIEVDELILASTIKISKTEKINKRESKNIFNLSFTVIEDDNSFFKIKIGFYGKGSFHYENILRNNISGENEINQENKIIAIKRSVRMILDLISLELEPA
jgi:hypothetical protein